MYIGDVVAIFKLLLGLTPQQKIFTPPPPHRCAGAAQPYTRLCVCFDSLLTRSKWNINSSCQVPGLHRVEVQRLISSSPCPVIKSFIFGNLTIKSYDMTFYSLFNILINYNFLYSLYFTDLFLWQFRHLFLISFAIFQILC